ncbi:two component, sigma54 specific, transcriptional regulator, Fis family [Desulfarculus baarsii DSM 2075]|uniref:Two component, sigma54 specific, transcriptional regulator, Fis family n=1 Tax=Desulfarculus baarsii (strain ATCC 33931 / DSM 2075 / LMG 7858 / VKM B-1802 / 2st14) TaxID=644282 RepID=E1QL94_DESB2|nr:sigma-54 dependent transcriptional regulator [Desulfarculus baarsii]ADK85359.1 two component, sigma54 specific, transcriptional regulator, Fis family [Desulfarculus baarsii DSM 2075]
MGPKNCILVVEDDRQSRIMVRQALALDGHEVIEAADGDSAMALLRRQGFQLVLTDLRLPGAGGLEILGYITENMPGTPVIVMSGFGSIDLAVEAMRRGAYDFQEKPLNTDHLRMTVDRALHKAALSHAYDYLRREQPYIYKFDQIVAESAVMKDLLRQAAKLAGSDITVLLTGETGTGKSLIAGGIHANSPRAEHTLVTVNCAALPETLLESELFGHEKGAFTGADKARVGRIQQAHGGTLFLDEVGDMSPVIQAKLLRALEDKIIQPLGSSRSIKVDVRVISATNVDLVQAVADGRFREDLFYRLGVTTLEAPPLRQRREDILPLAERFIHQICGDSKRPHKELDQGAADALLAHNWPGNVRELRNALERAVLLSEGPKLTRRDLNLGSHGNRLGDSPGASRGFDLEKLERETIVAALRAAGWVQARAAELLGISPRALNYKLQKLAISHPELDARRRR